MALTPWTTGEVMVVTDVFLLVFSGVVAISTLIYAYLTWRLVGETRRMREVQTEPKISVFVELNEHISTGMDLVIRNDGQGPAYNIRFTFRGDPTYFGGDRPVDQLPVIRNGLTYLAPNQTFRFMLGFLFGDAFNNAIQNPWSIDVVYESQSEKSCRDSYTIDFSQFSELIVGGGSPLYKIEKHLDALQRDVHHLTTGFHKIRVITQTQEEERKGINEIVKEQRARTAAEGDDHGNG